MLDFIDVRRAYVHALPKRLVYVKLPAEDHEEGMCGKLYKAMYGTRDAAQNWEHAYTEFMLKEGFVAGMSNPCIFYNEIKDIRVVVHGDDFTILAKEGRLNEFKVAMESRFEIKLKARLKDIGDSVRILNRVVTVTDEGIEYEADQRHSEIIVRELGLDSKSKTVVTPGIKDSSGEAKPSQLSSHDITMFRAMAARAN